MRIMAMTTAVLLSCTLGPSFAGEPAGTPMKQAQSAVPVQPDRAPEQAGQAREQDRKDAEDVQVGRDWKAQGGAAGGPAPQASESDQDHQTVGRDWRAHPDDKK
jgi:hypothetical protein